ncbi:MAG: hypothetical protein AAGA48_14115 [Myxococcota bacterium]
MFIMATIGIAFVDAAFAQATPPETEPAPPLPPPAVLEPVPELDPSSFEQQLAIAKSRYFSGETEKAAYLMTLLWDRMKRGEDPGPKMRAETLTYLGEIHYKASALVEAEEVFRWLFEEDPNAEISPFHHPMEVVTFFKTIKAKVELERRQALSSPPNPGAPPVWTFMPLGIPQATQGRGGAALAFGGLQAALVATNIALYFHLSNVDVGPENHPRGWTSDERSQRVSRLTYGVQWPAATLFYVTWTLSARDGVRHWRRGDVKRDLTVIPLGPRATPGLTLTHRFGGRPRR